ncbi:MAG: hypothetical protein RIC55_28955 [Pirellulaceae bacterium]
MDTLVSDEFALRFAFVSNPRAVHRALQRSEEVGRLRSAISQGEVTECSIRTFIAELLRALEYGTRFPNEYALAALAVALETRLTPFAEEFVTDLARLDLAETPIAIRVARETVRRRLRLPINKTKQFTLSNGDRGAGDWREARVVRRVAVGQVVGDFLVEAS